MSALADPLDNLVHGLRDKGNEVIKEFPQTSTESKASGKTVLLMFPYLDSANTKPPIKQNRALIKKGL